jgi:hypothetical protein
MSTDPQTMERLERSIQLRTKMKNQMKQERIQFYEELHRAQQKVDDVRAILEELVSDLQLMTFDPEVEDPLESMDFEIDNLASDANRIWDEIEEVHGFRPYKETKEMEGRS